MALEYMIHFEDFLKLKHAFSNYDMQAMKGVVSLFSGNTLQLHKGDLRILYISMDPLIKTCTAERDIIITLIDSGICPDFRSGKVL